MKQWLILPVLPIMLALAAVHPPGFNFVKSWRNYQRFLESCNCPTKDTPASTLNALDQNIAPILKEARDQGKVFTAVYLRANIEQTRLQIALYKYKQGIIPYSQLRAVIEDLLITANLYADQAQAYAALVSEKCKSEELNCLGVPALDQAAFDTTAWVRFYVNSTNLINDVEEAVFHKMLPEITVRKLDEFIRIAPYSRSPKQRNHKVNEAFHWYYKMLTADGEPVTLEAFAQHIYQEKGDEYWKSLFDDNAFMRMYQNDLSDAHNWSKIVTNPAAQVDDLISVIREAAPREIAYVALMKWIAPQLSQKKFAEAADFVQLYKTDFTGKKPYHAMEVKFNHLLSLLRQLESEQNPDFHFADKHVPELDLDTEAIEYFFNTDQTMLAVMPLGRGKMPVFKQINPGIFKHKHSPPADPGFNVYSFVQNIPRQKDSIQSLHPTALNLDKIDNGVKASSDFFFSQKHKVAFFVSLSRTGRRDTVSNSAEYASPWLAPDFDYKNGRPFQEYSGNVKAFHGKQNGNLNTDIYYIVQINGNWQQPKLLCQQNGDKFSVNTPFCERSPVLSTDGSTLYFSSEGYAGQGGFDVYQVQISIRNSNVFVTGPVQPVPGVNSPADELFYNPVNSTEAYFSSNRKTGRFRIHHVQKKTGKAPGSGPVRPPVPARSNKDTWIDMNDAIDLEPHCIQVKYPDESLNGKEIWIMGRIYDKRRNLIPKARIAFYPVNGPPKFSDVNLAKHDSIYQVLLPTNSRSILIRVTGHDINNDTIVAEFTTHLDTLCPNENRKTQMRIDYALWDLDEIVRKCIPMYVPIFFETNVRDRFVNMENSMVVYFQKTFESYTKNRIRFFLIGYADERGSKEYNLKLSQDRAETVQRFFVSYLGYTNERTKPLGAGKTIDFNNDNWKQHECYIPENIGIRFSTGIEKIWFQNRRVMIYYKYF